MTRHKVFFIVLLLGIAAMAQADLSLMFRSLGDETQSDVDPLTGTARSYWSSGDQQETLAQPGRQVWIENGRYLLFESARSRPVGSGPASERQLIAADTDTGVLYWLGAISPEDVTQYGSAHIDYDCASHYACAPEANFVCYRDVTGHRLNLLNLNTGSNTALWHLTTGTYVGPPIITPQGDTVYIHAVFPGLPSNDLISGNTSVLLRITLDPATGQRVGNPFLSFTYVHQMHDGAEEQVNGLQINPRDPKHVLYFLTRKATSGAQIGPPQLWYGATDGSYNYLLQAPDSSKACVQPLWAADGRYIYYLQDGALARTNYQTRRSQVWTIRPPGNKVVLTHPRTQPITFPKAPTMSSVQITQLAVDHAGRTMIYVEQSAPDHPANVYALDLKSGRVQLLVVLPVGETVSGGVCPQFSPDDARLALIAGTTTGTRLLTVDLHSP